MEVGPTRVEGLVHVSSLNDDYKYRSRQNRLLDARPVVFINPETAFGCG